MRSLPDSIRTAAREAAKVGEKKLEPPEDITRVIHVSEDDPKRFEYMVKSHVTMQKKWGRRLVDVRHSVCRLTDVAALFSAVLVFEPVGEGS